MPAAANIDEALEFAPGNIATVAYDSTPPSLFTQMSAWIAGMFSEATGIFKPSSDPLKNPGQRVVTNWYAQHVIAKTAIEGPGVSDPTPVGTAAVIDAVTRVLWAVKFGVTNGHITTTQRTAVVTLFNTCWA